MAPGAIANLPLSGRLCFRTLIPSFAISWIRGETTRTFHAAQERHPNNPRPSLFRPIRRSTGQFPPSQKLLQQWDPAIPPTLAVFVICPPDPSPSKDDHSRTVLENDTNTGDKNILDFELGNFLFVSCYANFYPSREIV